MLLRQDVSVLPLQCNQQSLSSCCCVVAAALKFGRGNKSIVGMTSSEGESFAFRSLVPVEGAVESWMTGVEAEMRRTLAVVMKEGESCREALPLMQHVSSMMCMCGW